MEEMYQLKDLKMKIIDNTFAKTFIQKWHYSKTCTHIVVAIGEFVGLEMKNCIIFNYCAGREMAKQVLKNGSNANVIELSRMVSLEPKPKNLESYCIARALKWLKQNMPNIKVVISYADNSVGHHGYCYQASGFTYYGQSRTTREHFIDGRRVHEKNLYNRFGTTKMQDLKNILGCRYSYKENDKSKSRYYKIIAQSKKEKKDIEKNILVASLPYPKGDNERYDMYIKGSFKELDIEKAKEKDQSEVIQQLSIFDL